MKKRTKRVAILLLLAVMIPMLAACGGPKGKYQEEYGSYLDFDGDSLIVSDGTFKVEGTYTLKGDQLTVRYTSPFGYANTEEGTYDKKTNTITLDGDVYRSVSGGSRKSSSGSAWKTVLWIVLGAVVLGGGYLFLKNRSGRGGRRPNLGSVQDTIYRASRSVASTAANVGGRAAASARGVTSAVAAGVSAGVAEGKNARRERRRIEITPYTCCICGRSLEDGATPLGGLASGQEAWIDGSCLQKLQAMSQGDSYEEFEQALRYMHAQAQVTDPEVSEALGRFAKKCAARFAPPQNSDPFQL